MKRNTRLLVFAEFVSIMVFFGCGKVEEGPTPTIPPSSAHRFDSPVADIEPDRNGDFLIAAGKALYRVEVQGREEKMFSQPSDIVAVAANELGQITTLTVDEVRFSDINGRLIKSVKYNLGSPLEAHYSPTDPSLLLTIHYSRVVMWHGQDTLWTKKVKAPVSGHWYPNGGLFVVGYQSAQSPQVFATDGSFVADLASLSGTGVGELVRIRFISTALVAGITQFRGLVAWEGLSWQLLASTTRSRAALALAPEAPVGANFFLGDLNGKVVRVVFNGTKRTFEEKEVDSHGGNDAERTITDVAMSRKFPVVASGDLAGRVYLKTFELRKSREFNVGTNPQKQQ